MRGFQPRLPRRFLRLMFARTLSLNSSFGIERQVFNKCYISGNVYFSSVRRIAFVSFFIHLRDRGSSLVLC